MFLYDSVVKELTSLLQGYSLKKLPLGESLPEGESGAMIFKSDVAFELGGGTLAGVNGIAYDIFQDNEAWLIGDDLCDISSDLPYARFVLVGVDKEKLGTGHALYNSLRKIDYTAFHLTPEGFMLRISPLGKKESLVVDKKGKKENLSFAKLAAYTVNKYLAVEGVTAVKVLFVTSPTFDFEALRKIATHSEEITSALDHLLGKVKMDCNTCKLQPVCNEVEALCKDDFLN